MLMSHSRMLAVACFASIASVVATPAPGQEPGPVWPKLSATQQSEVMRFGDDFKQFIGLAKSEMTFVREAIKLVEANGFRKWPTAPSRADVRPGARWYAVNRDRTIVAFVVGSEPLTTGARIVNTHNDAVRIQLKPSSGSLFPTSSPNELVLRVQVRPGPPPGRPRAAT